MNLDDLIEITGGKLLNKKKPIHVNKIKIDSRQVLKDDLFIALIGKNYDSHNYIKDVLKKRPSSIIVCKKIDIKTDVPIILVSDTYDSLIKLGAFFRKKFPIDVIAITGSVGKTSTKEILGAILENKYRVLKNEKNYNNHIGVPLTLFNLDETYDLCILEMGMNHLGEISKLSCMAKPNVAVITNIGSAHIGNLGSKKNILKAKMEITDGLDSGLLIVNGCDKLLKHVKYPNLLKAGTTLKPYDIKVSNQVSFKLKIKKREYQFCYQSSNVGLIMDFIIAIEIGLIYNIDINDMIKTIYNYKWPSERMNVYVQKNFKIIDDTYNASLESVKASLDVLKREKLDKVLILGDILELGPFSFKIHKKIGKYLHTIKNIDVLLVGSEVKNIKGKNYKYFKNNKELIEYLKDFDKTYKVFLIKGSRRMHLEQIVDYLKFDKG